MLSDQTFDDKLVIWVGPEMFFLPKTAVPDMEICMAFANNELLLSQYDFMLVTTESNKHLTDKLSELVAFKTTIHLPDVPDKESHRMWRYACRTVFCIYSPTLADQYRHRSSNVLPTSSPSEAYKAFVALASM